MIRLIIWCKPFARYILAGWIITILTVSSIPSIPTLKIHTAKADIRIDYLIHFCEYGLLAFMSFLSFTGKDFKTSSKKLALITLGLIAFAFIDEIHQKFIPGRAFNINDVISDIAGIAAALLFSVLLFREIYRKFHKADLHHFR